MTRGNKFALDIFREVSNIEDLVNEHVIPWSINTGMAVAILIIGRWVAGIIVNVVC